MSSYVQLVKPTATVVSRDEAIKQCRVVDPSDYGYLDALILKATRKVERDLERQLMTATWQLVLDRFPCVEIEIRKPPVQSVTKLEYIGTDGVLVEMDPDDYQVSIRGPDSPGRIMPAYSTSWPTTRCQTYDAVRVTFTCGYAPDEIDPDDLDGNDPAENVPATIKHAILFLVAHLFENREPVNIGNSTSAIPLTYDALLASEAWGAYS